MVKVALAGLVALSLSGCGDTPYDSGYKKGFYEASYTKGISDGRRDAFGSEPMLKTRVRDLEMQNAALRAANKHLLELDNVRK